MDPPGFRFLYFLFFFSGFPALIYQIVWQRTLFAVYGVNIESVTVVVSAFMLGLGLGSLSGGWLSKRPRVPLLLVFGTIELGIAAFGLVSLRLFHWVAGFTAGTSAVGTGLISLALVLFPTLLMGATLPLLVAHLVRLSGNVGRSVGILYFVNTLGSAAACFVAALYTMRHLGMSGSIAVAAAINILVGCTVLLLHFRWGAPAGAEIGQQPGGVQAALLPFPMALAIVALAGFISLGYEIVWYRVYSFVTGSSARSFAFVLGAFLAGIAFGSLLSRRLCREPATRNLPRFVRQIALLVVLANALSFASVPLIALAVRHMDYVVTLPLVAIAAGLLGATFPLMCHVSLNPDSRAGEGLSYLYLANIAGSASGSFVVGFVLMDVWPLRGIAVFLVLLGLATAAAVLVAARLEFRERLGAGMLAGALAGMAALSAGPLFAGIYEQLQLKARYQRGYRFAEIVETRSGVITVDENDTIYGGGVYDGRLTTDIRDTDTVLRPFSIAFLHPDPKDVLIIGMAGGAWSQVVANHPRVEHVVVVEINPGYLQVIPEYPEVAPVLRNPKVELYLDDGHRWLLRHPERRFDFVLMDTTFHWRANATNLLSREFLELIRLHLKPGGIHYYNTTQSPEAQLTGLTVFPYGIRFGPFIAASDSPIPVDKERWRQTLVNYRLDGEPILDLTDPEDRARLDEVLAYADTLHAARFDPYGMETAESVRRRTRGKRIITDDNMASEWGR